MAKINITTNNQYIDGYIETVEHTIKNTDNTSLLNAIVYLHRNNTYTGSPSASTNCVFEIKIDSQPFTINKGYVEIPNNQSYVEVARVENVKIKHEDDGSKTVYVSASGTIPYASFDFSEQGTNVKLTKIARKSDVSTTSAYFELGLNNPIVMIGKKNSSYTSKITYKIPFSEVIIGTIVEETEDTQYIWVLDEELINQMKNKMPSTPTVKIEIICETLTKDENDNIISLGSNSTYIEAKIVDTPTINDVELTELNSKIRVLTTDIVKGQSIVQLNIDAIAPLGTTISKYKVANGEVQSELSSNVVTLNNIQSSYTEDNVLKTKFVITVTDARGNYSQFELPRSFLNYLSPSFLNTEMTVKRLNQVSNKVKLNAKGTFYNGLLGETQNSLTFSYQYKQKSESEWHNGTTEIVATMNGNNFSINDLELDDSLDYTKNYLIQFNVGDLLVTSLPVQKTISSGIHLVQYRKDRVDFLNATIKNDPVSTYKIGDIFITTNTEDPADRFGGTWERIAEGQMLIGAGTGTDINGLSKTFEIGENSGEYEHTLTVDEMPKHGHPQNYAGAGGDTNRAVTASTGGSTSSDNTHGIYQGSYMASQNAWSSTYRTIVGTGQVGSDKAHNNMPPTFAVFIWRRVA